jgi:transposase-like protein
MTKKATDEDGLRLVLSKMTRAELARRLNIQRQSLTRWKRIPVHHVSKVSELTGFTREQILPSVYQ